MVHNCQLQQITCVQCELSVWWSRRLLFWKTQLAERRALSCCSCWVMLRWKLVGGVMLSPASIDALPLLCVFAVFLAVDTWTHNLTFSHFIVVEFASSWSSSYFFHWTMAHRIEQYKAKVQSVVHQHRSLHRALRSLLTDETNVWTNLDDMLNKRSK